MDVIPILILSNQGWEKDLAHHYPGKKLGVKKNCHRNNSDDRLINIVYGLKTERDVVL